MTQKNRYFRRSKLSEAKFRQLLRYFAMNLTATDCAELCGVSLRSVNAIYLRIRTRMTEHFVRHIRQAIAPRWHWPFAALSKPGF